MAGSTIGTVVKVGLLGAGGYLLYRYFAPTITAAPSASGGSATSTAPATPAAPAFNSLDSIYHRLATVVGSTPYTLDQFNYYLAQQLPAGMSPPDFSGIMPEGWDRSKTYTLANYWGLIAPKLKSQLGLSGLGLFGGLGNLARRYAH